MTRFVLIRHGEPDYQYVEARNFKGHGNDLAFLTEEGIKQATIVSKDDRLKGSNLIIASPYTRTLHTASIISKELNLDIHGELDLHEWLPDLSFDYRVDKIPYVNYKRAIADFINNIDNNSEYESLMNVKRRALEVLKRYLNYSKVLVVTHGGVMYSLTGTRNSYCGVVEVDYDEEVINNMLVKSKTFNR